MTPRVRSWASVVFFLGSVAAFCAVTAHADHSLVREMEALRNSLSVRDASRPALTLRLSDLWFNESVENRASDPAHSEKARQRAITLYNEALSGEGGAVAPASTGMVPKIQFQLARLHSEGGETAKARAIWTLLAAFDGEPVLKREASLRLAESLEAIAKTPAQMQEAELRYTDAIGLCQGTDLCSYARYRRAWLMYRQERLAPAIAEMKLALWDSKGQIREESLRDLTLFTARIGDENSVRTALSWTEEFAEKHKRPALIHELAVAYFAAGNRAAGTIFYEYLNTRAPSLKYQARLLEEHYGVRNWERFRSLLGSLELTSAAALDETDRLETEKVLRRLAVQLDGERASTPEHAGDFKALAEAYLAIYPGSPIRARMIDGWLAAETVSTTKIARLAQWIADAMVRKDAAEELRLREVRAAEGQKIKDYAVVSAEMEQLARFAPTGSAKQREFSYHRARALYELKDLEGALAGFRALAKPDVHADKWAVQSQNLALDVLNQLKRPDELAVQAALWTADPSLRANPAMAGELSEMDRIAEQARFEAASAAAASAQAPAARRAQALAEFQEFCASGKFIPRSCENARVLALSLKDEAALLASLRKLAVISPRAVDFKADLRAELEASAHFGEAAQAYQAHSGPGSVAEAVRLSLLFGLEGKDTEAQGVLRSWASSRHKKLATAEEEGLLLLAFEESGGLSPALLKSAVWSAEGRGRLAERLEQNGNSTAETRKIISSSDTRTGAAWDQLVLNQVKDLDARQATVGFYGKKGQALFKRRLAALDRLEQTVRRRMGAASLPLRAQMAAITAQAFQNLSAEILASPLPEGLTAEQLQGVRSSLAEMALPFAQKSETFTALEREQLAKASEISPVVPVAAVTKIDWTQVRALYSRLQKDPQDRDAILKLKTQFDSAGRKAAAAYFEGRSRKLPAQAGGSSS